MRKLKLEIQISLDGYMAEPDGNTNWMIWNWGEDWTWDKALQAYHTALTTSSDCILLSRKMAVEGFVHHWAKTAANTEGSQYIFSKAVTDMQKVVFTHTLEKSEWDRTTLAKGDLVQEVNQLKQQPGKDLIAYGGSSFATSLLEAGLVDELHLFVNPILLGNGMPFFDKPGHRLPLELESCQAYTCGMAVMKYVKKT